MRNKLLIILMAIFISRVAISCCDCSSALTYENIYTGVDVIPYDNSGFYSVEAEGKVYKNAFGLGITVDFESKVYANNISSLSGFGFGFGFAMAFSCDCVGDEYLYPDPISCAKIYVLGENDEKLDVTGSFLMEWYSGEMMSLDEFFSQRESWQDGFQVKLAKFDLIPDSTVFYVEVYLQSGAVFSNQTQVVEFY